MDDNALLTRASAFGTTEEALRWFMDLVRFRANGGEVSDADLNAAILNNSDNRVEEVGNYLMRLCAFTPIMFPFVEEGGFIFYVDQSEGYDEPIRADWGAYMRRTTKNGIHYYLRTTDAHDEWYLCPETQDSEHWQNLLLTVKLAGACEINKDPDILVRVRKETGGAGLIRSWFDL